MRVQPIIQDLLNGAVPISVTLLARLSDLDPQETDAVLAALRQVSAERRRLIVRRLMELAEENVDLNFDLLLRRCIGDEDGEVREIAVLALWECEERSLIDPLVGLLKHDSEEQVRAAAAQSLGRFALLAELGKLLQRDAQKIEGALIQTIEGDAEQSLEVQRRAIEALAPLDNPRVREIIRETYGSTDERLRASALYAMGRNGDPSWIPYILEEMESPASELRYEAAVAAGQLGDESLVPPLARLVEDADIEVQVAAIAALSAVGGAAAVRALRRILRKPDHRLRELAQDALESMEPHEIPALDLLHQRGPGLARQARPAPDADEETEADTEEE